MNVESIQFYLQLVSVIVIPIFTAVITWITNSLRKINKRMDTIEDRFNNSRLESSKKTGELAASIKEMQATQKHILDTNNKLDMSINRVMDWIMENKK